MTENAQQRAERRYRLLHTALKEMAEFERKENEFRKKTVRSAPQNSAFLWIGSKSTERHGQFHITVR